MTEFEGASPKLLCPNHGGGQEKARGQERCVYLFSGAVCRYGNINKHIALAYDYNSCLRPSTYLNVSGTDAHASPEQLA